jgi:hypothetical protein
MARAQRCQQLLSMSDIQRNKMSVNFSTKFLLKNVGKYGIRFYATKEYEGGYGQNSEENHRVLLLMSEEAAKMV